VPWRFAKALALLCDMTREDEMDLRCPECGSENTQRLSLLVGQGTLATISTGLAVGQGRGGPVGGIGGAIGKTTSELAKLHAAPKRESVFWAPILIAALGAALSLAVGAWAVWAAAAFALWGLFSAASYNIRSYPAEAARWANSYLCLRCSHPFETAPADVSSSETEAHRV
jgi:DNA-directed RNA polymerase subunit RPC12/RpoP